MAVESRTLKTVLKNIQFKVIRRSRLKPINEWPVKGKKTGNQRFGGIFQEATGKSLENHVLPDN